MGLLGLKGKMDCEKSNFGEIFNILPKLLNICLNINIIMAFKTLTIKESVYKKLLLMKKKDESFSDLFERLSNSNIELLKKMRGCNTYENKKEMLKEIFEKRKEKRYR
jgi:predicted CopG family antitoxin